MSTEEVRHSGHALEGEQAPASEQIRAIQVALRELSSGIRQVSAAVGTNLGLQPGDLEVLDLVSRQGPQTPRELAAAFGIHPATLTGVLDRLEGGGWIARSRDATDRRKVQIVHRSERASELLRQFSPMSRALAQLCVDYSPEQLALIRDFVERAAELGAPAAATIRSYGPEP
jgi:DNA-binding MarR family transcriptional regulator